MQECKGVGTPGIKEEAETVKNDEIIQDKKRVIRQTIQQPVTEKLNEVSEQGQLRAGMMRSQEMLQRVKNVQII